MSAPFDAGGTGGESGAALSGTALIRPIAYMHSDFSSKFGIPRQSGLVDELRSRIVFTEEYRVAEALRGIEGYSHLWVIWQFSQAVQEQWSPTVRPPRLGGNQRVGVFATRSPFRPNSLGLSAVRLVEVCREGEDAPLLVVAGADLLDGTPIYDIKPYIPHADCLPQAVGGFSDRFRDYALRVDFAPELLERVEENKRAALLGVLAQDPRPAYQHDAERVYGLDFAGYAVRFSVRDDLLTVVAVEKTVIM